jgi:integrase
MPRRRKYKYLAGINRVVKKSPGKPDVEYFYAWRGRGAPLIADKDGNPLTDWNSPEFAIAFAEALKKKKTVVGETLATIVDLYKDSSEFKLKTPKTRQGYLQYLKLIEAKFGSMTLNAIQDPRSRGIFKSWRDTMAATPRTADYAWTTLARLLSFAKDRGKISVNVCERGGRLYAADRAEKIWTADDIRKFCAAASPELQSALLLALWTGQRQGDLLKLTWGNYDGLAIRLRQGKTGNRVTIPVGKPLKAALDAARAIHEAAKAKAAAAGDSVIPATVLISSRGLPWTADGFKTSWGRTFKKAELADLHFHDLRGTAVTRLALAECTIPQIAAITGHSLADVEAILDAHYLGGQVELAEAAITKLNAAYAK